MQGFGYIGILFAFGVPDRRNRHGFLHIVAALFRLVVDEGNILPFVGDLETFAYAVAVEGNVIGCLAGHCPNVGPG